MTPAYVFGEMTLEEVQTAIDHVFRWEIQGVSRDAYKRIVSAMERWLVEGVVQQQNLSWIKEPIGKVICKNG